MKHPFTLVVSLSLICILGIFSSCKEEIKTNRELLTGSTWEFATASSSDTFNLILVQGVYTGSKQNFFEDGTYITDLAVLEDDSGTWKLGVDNLSIIFDEGTAFEGEVSIVELTEDILTYADVEKDSTGASILELSFTAE